MYSNGEKESLSRLFGTNRNGNDWWPGVGRFGALGNVEAGSDKDAAAGTAPGKTATKYSRFVLFLEATWKKWITHRFVVNACCNETAMKSCW